MICTPKMVCILQLQAHSIWYAMHTSRRASLFKFNFVNTYIDEFLPKIKESLSTRVAAK